jgi:hypothetical protein
VKVSYHTLSTCYISHTVAILFESPFALREHLKTAIVVRHLNCLTGSIAVVYTFAVSKTLNVLTASRWANVLLAVATLHGSV